ncbi:GntR family transcriptional regulator (plasmid) [Rhodococcus pseudokoreensis]|uniref:GntR family transcriptional regulator n=1 Tax=Rhodococcus pseudokoreensis TaxID=2811421 RepID=A0A974VZH3_9NOCA|nr:GntR family transcriptional regulator [Rhodococcus pseudokoreensis]QSE88084.1 GntR family transcriptional regulator [Rhodococcus pseudokoreensis]
MRTVSDLVYSTVKELILSAELPGGELISEGDIANQVGTSRTPVREAFLRLEAEGWMKLFPKRGALVVPIADGEAEHIVEARLLVEAGSLCAIRSDAGRREDAAAEMRASVIRQLDLAKSADRAAFTGEDADFHSVVVRYGANPLLAAFYIGLRDRQRRMTACSVGRDPMQLDRVFADHAQLASFVEHGQVEEFKSLLGRHMREVHQLTGGR